MIRITKADLALLQDRGRFGYESVGVPRSGAWDLEQYDYVAALLDEPMPVVIEILAGSFGFDAEQDAEIAVVADGTAKTATVAAGTNFTIVTTSISYIGIRGLSAHATLGSSSSDTVSGLGPARLSVGDCFEVAPSLHTHRVIKAPAVRRDRIRFVPGPHRELAEVRVAVVSTSRSGIRFSGGSTSSVLAMASIPITPGAIQDTGEELIIVGPDGAVTGGYPVVGVVVAADQPLLARLAVGEAVTLTPVDLGRVPDRPKPTVVDLGRL